MDCNLFFSIYIKEIFKIHLLYPSHFNLFQSQSLISILYSVATLHLYSFHITHLLPKQRPISIHILIHLRQNSSFTSFFALIFTPFNIFLFFSVSFHAPFFCLFISSSKHFLPGSLLSPSRRFCLIVPPETPFDFPLPLTEPHTSLALSTIDRSNSSLLCSTVFFPSHSILFPSRDLAILLCTDVPLVSHF